MRTDDRGPDQERGKGLRDEWARRCLGEKIREKKSVARVCKSQDCNAFALPGGQACAPGECLVFCSLQFCVGRPRVVEWFNARNLSTRNRVRRPQSYRWGAGLPVTIRMRFSVPQRSVGWCHGAIGAEPDERQGPFLPYQAGVAPTRICVSFAGAWWAVRRARRR